MRVGVLGGTFDPIHVGHLVLAEEGRQRLQLERVVFIPAGEPWRKASQPISAGEHRLAMVRLAVADNQCFEVSAVEVERSGPSYTVDTLAALRGEWGAAAEVYLLMGEDALEDLPNWRDPLGIVAQAWLAVVPRLAGGELDVQKAEASVPGIARKLVTFDMPRIDISATELRRRAAAGESLRYLVPEPVEDYIRRHRLYAPGS
jgi:nicotinate-nucleotide adenylyltransferase